MNSFHIPIKRKYAADDPFFEEGNIALRAYRLEKEAENSEDVAMIRDEASALSRNWDNPIYCELPLCRKNEAGAQKFYSVAAYDSHYETMHKYICIQCQKSFPSDHILQLHLDELHNIFTKIRKERGEKTHTCFVEGCAKQFSEPKMRRLHLVDKHHYPRSFPFDIIVTGTLSFEARRQRILMRRRPTRPPPPDIAMDVDNLTSHMARIKIPASISFGHAKPVLHSVPKPSTYVKHSRPPSQSPCDDSMPAESRPNRKRGPKKKMDNMDKMQF